MNLVVAGSTPVGHPNSVVAVDSPAACKAVPARVARFDSGGRDVDGTERGVPEALMDLAAEQVHGHYCCRRFGYPCWTCDRIDQLPPALAARLRERRNP